MENNVVSGGRALERRTVNRGDGGSIPPAVFSKLHICMGLSEDTIQAGGSLYLVSMSGEIKNLT